MKKLFNLKQGETVLEALNNQTEKLQSTNKLSSTYLIVIQNVEELNEEDITWYQKWRIQQKAQYLALALNLAKENMNNWMWMKCCETAVKQLTQQGCTHEMVSKLPRDKAIPNTMTKEGSATFLSHNPDICMKIKQWGKENITTLSIESRSEYIMKLSFLY